MFVKLNNVTVNTDKISYLKIYGDGSEPKSYYVFFDATNTLNVSSLNYATLQVVLERM